jgi:hypothetical protein
MYQKTNIFGISYTRPVAAWHAPLLALILDTDTLACMGYSNPHMPRFIN